MGASSPCSSTRSRPCFEIGTQRVVVHLAAGEDGDLVVQQVHELPHDPALRLAAQAEQDEVLAGEQRVDDARHDGVLVADDAGEQRVAGAQPAQEVRAHLVLHGPRG
jgi:hypothetical protein